MCGIVGFFNFAETQSTQESSLRQMLAMVRHRGPDGFGIYRDQHVGLGSARLSIIDLAGGDQPISNEDGSLWIVFNGEIFNYIELRPDLEAHGHRFKTNSDTEVIIHLYEEYGPNCLKYLNGQFAMAIWDKKQQSLFLGRDRLGINPLFYTVQNKQLLFASEIKAILAYPGVQARVSLAAIDQVFTYWSTIAPATAFQDIFMIPPAHYLMAHEGQINLQRYWELDFTNNQNGLRSEQDYQDELESLLVDATTIRLRADVPVGAYLSGGLDSSTIAALIRNYTNTPLDTFSISFSDPEFDESYYQRQMANFLGTQHQVVYMKYADIGAIFPDVIWHTEIPVLRTTPVPMFCLSEMVRENHYKVVLTGEGADEFLAGYDIFKEARIRRFWAEEPESKIRPELLKSIYTDIAALQNGNAYLASFFGLGLRDTDSPDYSHRLRWRSTSRTKRFFSNEFKLAFESNPSFPNDRIDYPAKYSQWDPLSRAQYLESSIFLPQYLLSSQGDRMTMAHSVEGRYPFLDHRVVEFCNRLPPEFKLLGLSEKYLLRKLANKWLPKEISSRPKRPYRAPIHKSFFNHASAPEYINELLAPQSISAAGFFDPEAVRQLTVKLREGKRVGETDDMALAGIISSQILWRLFIVDFQRNLPPPVSKGELIKDIFENEAISGVVYGI